MKYKDQRCGNCQFESLTATSHPCVGCRQGGEQGQPDELNWQPKITETVDLINTRNMKVNEFDSELLNKLTTASLKYLKYSTGRDNVTIKQLGYAAGFADVILEIINKHYESKD